MHCHFPPTVRSQPSQDDYSYHAMKLDAGIGPLGEAVLYHQITTPQALCGPGPSKVDKVIACSSHGEMLANAPFSSAATILCFFMKRVKGLMSFYELVENLAVDVILHRYVHNTGSLP